MLPYKLCNDIFTLPSGTTDTPCEVADNPMPTEKEIKFILSEIKNYLSPDVMGMWSFFCMIRKVHKILKC